MAAPSAMQSGMTTVGRISFKFHFLILDRTRRISCVLSIRVHAT